ncbi:MAG: hypothetical protein ACR2OI_06350 [Acidimicrobiia bacterium]
MDTTRTEELLTRLETADPAQAPDAADELAAALAEELDGGPAEAAAGDEPEASPESGETP